jgi:DNA-directed RNA polymerase subunit RPC12/RpoP
MFTLAGRTTLTLFDNPEEIACPSCTTPNPLEILYGLPSNEMQLAESGGAIALGGCIVGDESPAYRCRDCGHEFGEV